MTPLESVFMLSHSDHIDKRTMNNVSPSPYHFTANLVLPQIVAQGHSRVPVYRGERDNIIGILLVKRLIHLDPDDCTPVASLEGANTPPPSCLTSMPLFDLLNKFQTGRSQPTHSLVGIMYTCPSLFFLQATCTWCTETEKMGLQR